MSKDDEKWKDTNVGLIGSKADLENRIRVAKTEVEWKGAGKKPGIQIWRIEKFNVKKWAPERYGEFYGGDAYIVLNTYKKAEALAWNVHFWLGKECTIDEMGTAAIKTIELDDLLGTLPKQYREVQGHESHDFLSLFKNGIRILEGGIETGFRHVKKKEYKPRLLHVKGRRYVRCMQVPLAVESLNTGDPFILDAGDKCWLWLPKKANHNEKFKTAQVSQEIRNSRKGKLAEERIDQDGTPAFWKFFGLDGKPDKIKSPKEVQSDKDFDDQQGGKFKKVMFKLSDESGKMEFKKVSEVGKNSYLNKKDLDTMDVFVIDAGSEVIAWIGKGASPMERKKAILYATNFLSIMKKPIWTRVVRVEEGREGKKFWELFL